MKNLFLSWILLLVLPISDCLAEMKSEQALTPQMIFLESIQNGQLEAVNKFVREKVVDPNQLTEAGVTPLHLAVMHNQEPIAAVLIQAGAKVDQRDSNTLATPLHMAALHGRTSIAKWLVEKDADVNATMRFGITPLMVAIQFKQPQIAEVLLSGKAKNKIKVNQADEEGFTALHCAAQNGDEITAKLLIKNGANLNALDKNQATPLMIANQNNKPEIAALLMGGAGSPTAGAKK